MDLKTCGPRCNDSLSDTQGWWLLMTDMERFDDFARAIPLRVEAGSVGGFLPIRQILTEKQAITFFFSDDGVCDDVVAMDLA